MASYYLYDVNGYKGDLATTLGLEDLRNAVERSTMPMPHTEKFLDLGWTSHMKEMAEELKKMKTKTPNSEGVKKFLIDTLPKCRHIAVMSDVVK